MGAAVPQLTRRPSRPPGHVSSLTGLRVFAALAVYFSHVAPPAGAPVWLATAMQAGYYGVTVFFVLSGFVLTLNYSHRLRSRQDLWSYTVARIARVYPLYLVCLLAAVAIYGYQGRLMQHLLALQAWDPAVGVAYMYNGPGWSIGVEAFLYVLLPLLILALARHSSMFSLLLGTVAVLVVMAGLTWWFIHVGRDQLPWDEAGSDHRWLYRSPLTRVGDFLLGIIAAKLYDRLRDHELARCGWLLIWGGACSIAFIATRPAMLFSAWSWDVAYAVPAAALILGLALAPRDPAGLLLSAPAVVFLGEASYAFYLSHKLTIEVMGEDAYDRVTAQTVTATVWGVCVAMLVAVTLHLLIERPAQTFLRDRLGGGRHPGARPPRPRVGPDAAPSIAPTYTPHPAATTATTRARTTGSS